MVSKVSVPGQFGPVAFGSFMKQHVMGGVLEGAHLKAPREQREMGEARAVGIGRRIRPTLKTCSPSLLQVFAFWPVGQEEEGRTQSMGQGKAVTWCWWSPGLAAT